MLVSLLLALLLANTAPDHVRRLPPTDGCAADASFVEFRSALLEAIERRDAAHILAVVADDITVDFGGGEGRAYFADAWNLEEPLTSELWHEVGEALRLGCTIDETGSYWAPALFLAQEVDDPFATFLVVRPGATLHAAADANSAVLATLEWDLVEGVEWQEGDAWWRVRLADGREGFARRENLRSPVDYRAGFQRIDGRWRMVAFIAGD